MHYRFIVRDAAAPRTSRKTHPVPIRVPEKQQRSSGPSAIALQVLLLSASFPAFATPSIDTPDLPLPSDIAVIEGRQMRRLLGTRPSKIRVLAVDSEGTLRRVPHQIDERTLDSKGNPTIVFDHERGVPNETERRFDAIDLLLLWVPGAGPRLSEARDLDFLEIELRMRGQQRWLYVDHEMASPNSLQKLEPMPEWPSLRYDSESDTVLTNRYSLGFSSRGSPIINRLTLGAIGPNLMDRNKARLRCSLAYGLPTLERTEADVTARVTGIRAGPLRILREVAVRGRLFWGLYTPEVRQIFVFTPTAFLLPVTVSLSAALGHLIDEVSLRITMDLAPAAKGLRFSSSVAPGTVATIAGEGTPSALASTTAPIDWYLLRGPDIGLLGWLRTERDYALRTTLFYRDDSTRADPPEAHVGQFGHHGFLLRAPRPRPDGEIHLVTHALIVEGPQLADVETAIAEFEARPTVILHD